MSPIDITFATPTHPELRWSDSFEGLEEEEIEKLVNNLRVALAAFSAELTDRRKPGTDQKLENYKQKLQETAKQINEQGLTKAHEDHLGILKLFLAQAGSAQGERKESKTSKAGRQSLWLISNVIGLPYVLLFFCALGKHKVERINEDQRVKLLKYIVNHRESLFCRRLEDRTIQFRSQEEHIKVDLPLTRGSKKRKRRESTDGESVSLAGVVTDERAVLTDFSPSALERSISDPVIEPQNQVAALPRPLERFHDLPHDINLSLSNESILRAAGSCPPICENGKHNLDGEFCIKPATNLSASNTQVRTLPDAGTLSILRDSSISNVAPGSSVTIHNSGHNESAINPQHPESLANNPRSDSAVCFNLRLAQPVVAPTAWGLDTEKVDSVSAVRLCDWSRLNRQPMLKLAQDGLIKIQSSLLSGSPGSLLDFYVHSICAGRTLLKDNAYLQEVLPTANCDAATQYAMIALTSSYYKEYLPDESIQKEWMEKREVEAIAQTIMALEQNTRNDHVYRDTAKMLLIHHAILNQDTHSGHWTDYLYQLQDSPNQQSNLIMARHSIWLMTILPLNEKYEFQTFNYDWVGCGVNHSLTKVNGILGTSRKMLYFEYLVTIAAKFPNTVDHGNLLGDIEKSCQWVDVTETETATRIALKTAETYKLATKLYALARLCRFTPRHAGVRDICNRLTRMLNELPSSGDEYSGLHPAWCFPIACACTEDPKEFAKMNRILENIGNANKSNVSDLSRLVKLIWKWKIGRHLSEGWWEHMTEHLDSVMNGNLICVS